MTWAALASPALPADALAAIRVFHNDRKGLGGILVRARSGPARDAWLALATAGVTARRLPSGLDPTRLADGLDLAATLAAGRPVARPGLLVEAAGGVIVVPMAERLEAAVAAALAAGLDDGTVGLILFDEGEGDDPPVHPALVERMSCVVDLEAGVRDAASAVADGALVAVEEELAIVALCEAAAALGVASGRAGLLAWRVARASADGAAVTQDDVALAARLVLAPRATRVPEAEADGPAPATPSSGPPPPSAAGADEERASPDALTEIVTAAALAALPPGLLARLKAGKAPRGVQPAGQGQGAKRAGTGRGRPAGTRRGDPRRGGRLDLVATLTAAAPWQRLRNATPGRIVVRADDFRIRRTVTRAEAVTIFVVDASGSAALARLAETKGAVELLLAEAYVKRARVSLIAFRGEGAELLLPPTRSLTRARRALAALAGGGGTPLAAALDMTAGVARRETAAGRTPFVVLLTDGRANVARAGMAGRAKAEADALDAARALRGAGVPALFVDTAPRPGAGAAALAAAMGAAYVALPYVEAGRLAALVREAAPG